MFVLAGVFAALEGPARLDCRPNADATCHARERAGDLSTVHYAHLWLSIAIVAALAATPFALARAEWPSRLARLTLAGGVAGLVLWAFFLAIDDGARDDGLNQRLGLAVIHWWVVAVAVTLLAEASPRWASAVVARQGRQGRDGAVRSSP